MKTVEYFNNRIESLKATIRRLQAEKRIAVLREREKRLKSRVEQATIGGQADDQ